MRLEQNPKVLLTTLHIYFTTIIMTISNLNISKQKVLALMLRLFRLPMILLCILYLSIIHIYQLAADYIQIYEITKITINELISFLNPIINIAIITKYSSPVKVRKCCHSAKECLKCLIIYYIRGSSRSKSRRLNRLLFNLFYFFETPVHCPHHCFSLPERRRDELVTLQRELATPTQPAELHAFEELTRGKRLDTFILQIFMKNVENIVDAKLESNENLSPSEKESLNLTRVVLEKLHLELDDEEMASGNSKESFFTGHLSPERIISSIMENFRINHSERFFYRSHSEHSFEFPRGNGRDLSPVHGANGVHRIYSFSQQSVFIDGPLNSNEYRRIKTRLNQQMLLNISGQITVCLQSMRQPVQLNYLPKVVVETLKELGARYGMYSDITPKLFTQQLASNIGEFLRPGEYRVNSEKQFVRNLHWGVVSRIGGRKSMEDEFSIVPDFDKLLPEGMKNNILFVSIFDGHRGREAANYCRFYLYQNTAFFSKFTQSIITSLIRGYWTTEEMFLRLAERSHNDSGCTSLSIVCNPVDNLLTIANLGDSRAVVCRQGKAIELTTDHRPTNEKEQERIYERGGTIKFERVEGKLSVTRAIGDLNLEADKKLKGLSCTPDVIEHSISPEDEFVILACDGLWDLRPSEYWVKEARRKLHLSNSPQATAEALVDHAITLHADVIAFARKDEESGKIYFGEKAKQRQFQKSVPSFRKFSLPRALSELKTTNLGTAASVPKFKFNF